MLLVTAGVLALAWVVLVWRWQDPFTALYTHEEQVGLARSFDQELRGFRPLAAPQAGVVPAAAEARLVAREAAAFRREAKTGQAIGRIIVPRLGLNMILVNGTDSGSLEKGPGRDPVTYMPGQGRLVYIAGHRTTYLAPFSHIDAMRPGDRIEIVMPYATFVYRVTGHRIVAATDLGVLRSPRHEVVALQACHPRFFASHRYIVYGVPVRVIPRDGPAYGLPLSARA
ncbi:MAG: class E sortase [Actinobacteria bacterium]|nr:class E sortase [Actinomycetota bacterium]